METLILPVPSPIESQESQPSQPSPPSEETFAKVLEEQDRPPKTTASREAVKENPTSSNMGLWLPTLVTPTLSFSFAPPPLSPEPNFSGGRGLKNFPQLNCAMSEFTPAQNSSLSIQSPRAGTGVEEFPSRGISHFPQQHGKIQASEKDLGLLFNEGWADSEIDRKISLGGKPTGKETQGIQFLPSANHPGEEEILSSRIEFPNLPHPGYPHSAFFSEGSQDPGAALRLSIEMGGDVKAKFRPSLMESGKEEVYQQIGRKVIWSIHNHDEKIKMDLDPPDLGNIYMEICREKETIKATLWADNPTTKVALEASQIQLQKILENEGFRLERFTVFFQENLGSFQERKEAPFHSHAWEPPQLRDPVPEMAVGGNISLPSMGKPYSSSHHVDMWV